MARDEEEGIILMKSRGRRALDFIKIILSFSSSPNDFSTKNVRICNKYAIIWCYGGGHSKWNIYLKYLRHPKPRYPLIIQSQIFLFNIIEMLFNLIFIYYCEFFFQIFWFDLFLLDISIWFIYRVLYFNIFFDIFIGYLYLYYIYYILYFHFIL